MDFLVSMDNNMITYIDTLLIHYKYIIDQIEQHNGYQWILDIGYINIISIIEKNDGSHIMIDMIMDYYHIYII